MKTFASLLAVSLLFFGACAKETNFKSLPDGPIRHHLIVVGKTTSGVKARGFSGATPANTEVFFEAGKSRANVMSNADGSFVIELADADTTIQSSELTFSVENKIHQQGYQIRTLPDSLAKIAKEPFQTDKEVSAIVFFDQHVAIISSMANMVQTFTVDAFFRLANLHQTHLLAKPDQGALFPSALAVRADHIAVTVNMSHEVALIDRKRNKVIAKARVNDQSGELFRFNLPTSLTVDNPLDADESGKKTTTISRSAARNPECIIALDDTHFLVGFSNYYQFEDASQKQSAVVAPAVIALMTIDGDELKTSHVEVLDYKNPRYLVMKDKNTVWVSLSGAWSNIGQPNQTSSNAGLVRLKIAADFLSFTVDHKIPLQNFAPAMIAVVGNRLIVPNTNKNEIAVLDENASTMTDGDKKSPTFHRQFGFSFAKHWHDDIVFLGDRAGTLVAYSLKEESYFPFPFTEPVVIDRQVDERIGLWPQSIYFRHQEQDIDIKTSYPQGFTAWIVSDSHQKIYPLDFLEVFGP